MTKFGVQKNFETLFRAIAMIRKQYPVELILTLDEQTQEYNKVAATIAEMGIADIVRNYGEVAGDDIQDLYDSLDVFAFPSLCESFGFPLVEAMTSGLPWSLLTLPVHVRSAARHSITSRLTILRT